MQFQQYMKKTVLIFTLIFTFPQRLVRNNALNRGTPHSTAINRIAQRCAASSAIAKFLFRLPFLLRVLFAQVLCACTNVSISNIIQQHLQTFLSGWVPPMLSETDIIFSLSVLSVQWKLVYFYEYVLWSTLEVQTFLTLKNTAVRVTHWLVFEQTEDAVPSSESQIESEQRRIQNDERFVSIYNVLWTWQ